MYMELLRYWTRTKGVSLIMMNIHESEDKMRIAIMTRLSLQGGVGQQGKAAKHGHKQEQTIVIARHHPPSPPTPQNSFRNDDDEDDHEGEECNVTVGDGDNGDVTDDAPPLPQQTSRTNHHHYHFLLPP